MPRQICHMWPIEMRRTLRTWVARLRLRGGGINDTGQSDALLRRKTTTRIVGHTGHS